MELNFKKSTRKYKKYMVKHNDKWIHFGDTRYQHFRDTTKLKLYSNLDHNDNERRYRYLKRAKKIINKKGELTWNDPNSANYYSVKYLWSG
jgi:alpha-D-ribose 1-methylphosphonate 5-triphosphate diphosphatase PhnM